MRQDERQVKLAGDPFDGADKPFTRHPASGNRGAFRKAREVECLAVDRENIAGLGDCNVSSRR